MNELIKYLEIHPSFNQNTKPEQLEKILRGPWCPLLGRIPKLGLPLNSPENRCLFIIIESRKLWGIDFEPTFNRCGKNPDWPKKNSINSYPEKEFAEIVLKTAREIDRLSPSIMLNSEIRDPKKDYLLMEDGSYAISKGIDQVPIHEIRIVANSLLRPSYQKFKDQQLLASLAIYSAWHVFEFLIRKFSDVDITEILPRLYRAEGLLRTAKIIEGNEKAEDSIKLGFQKGQKEGISVQNRLNAKKPRRPDPLNEFILNILKKNKGNLNSNQMWQIIKANVGEDCIVTVTDSVIEYEDKNSRINSLKKKSFPPRFHRIKKLLF